MAKTSPTVHHVHTATVQDETGAWWVQLTLNGAPCGGIGPVAVEATADVLAEGLREGMRLALGKGQK